MWGHYNYHRKKLKTILTQLIDKSGSNSVKDQCNNRFYSLTQNDKPMVLSKNSNIIFHYHFIVVVISMFALM